MEIRCNTLAVGWPRMLAMILHNGERVDIKIDGKDVPTVEYPEPLIMSIKNVESGLIPKGSKWQNPAALNQYVQDVLQNRDTGHEYTYGQRLRSFDCYELECDEVSLFQIDQLDYMIDELKKNKTSRQAISSLWNVGQDNNSLHPPCLLVLDATVRKGKLNLTSYIRSNDMFGAYPENVALFAEINKYIAKAVDVLPGKLTTVSSKAHIYWFDVEEVGNITGKEDVAEYWMLSLGIKIPSWLSKVPS